MNKNMKKIATVVFFIAVMSLTLYTFLFGQNFSEIMTDVWQMNIVSLVVAAALGFFFVCMEGTMIYYLMRCMGEKMQLFRCFQYSFIGFFYSGITPSATGGQPMQLYYMNRDGKKTSDSTVTLMTVAVMYKVVLVVIGILLLVFWRGTLWEYLGSYFYLYLLGLLLNVVLVLFLMAVMVYPVMIRKTGLYIIHRLARWRWMKNEEKRVIQWNLFVDHYGESVAFLKNHKGVLGKLFGMTFIQRCSVFLLTYVVYAGFSLNGASAFTVMALQASVYIAVDMLPIPGAQGITELMYKAVFTGIFPAALLTPSMVVTRSVNFYLLLLVSLLITIAQRFYRKRSTV